MRSAAHSVRPPNNSIEVGGGPDALAGEGRLDGIGSRTCEAVVRPVFPMQEADGAAIDEGDLTCIPCEEEE